MRTRESGGSRGLQQSCFSPAGTITPLRPLIMATKTSLSSLLSLLSITVALSSTGLADTESEAVLSW